LNASSKCLKSKKKLIWFGFSNGGNHLNQFFLTCGGGNYITIGASGGYQKPEKKDLSNCGVYYATTGKADKFNYEKATRFYKKLKAAGARIETIEFDGGHEVKGSTLESLIDSALNSH